MQLISRHVTMEWSTQPFHDNFILCRVGTSVPRRQARLGVRKCQDPSNRQTSIQKPSKANYWVLKFQESHRNAWKYMKKTWATRRKDCLYLDQILGSLQDFNWQRDIKPSNRLHLPGINLILQSQKTWISIYDLPPPPVQVHVMKKHDGAKIPVKYLMLTY